MGNYGWKFACFVLGVALVASSCSSTSAGVEAESDASQGSVAAPADVDEQCQAGAQRVVQRFDEFLGEFGDVSPEEFLAQDEIQGLTEFQNDVAQILTETANQNSTLCNLDGLQGFVDVELAKLAESEDQGLLASYLISSIRFGGNLEVADVLVGPDDDIQEILSLLDDGSTMTLEAGVYDFDVPLLVARSVTLIGAGRDETVIRSSAAEAAFAAFSVETVGLRDLSMEHVGDLPASVILAFGGPVSIDNVAVSGAIADENTGGGNGVLLTLGESESGENQAQSRITNSVISDNMVAGIAVTGDLTPSVETTELSRNSLCGICFLEQSGGLVTNNTVTESDFGIQVGDQASPRIYRNTIRDNLLVGVVLLGTTTATVDENTVEANAEVGIALQESSIAIILNNSVGPHPFGITAVNDSKPTLVGNVITGADVGIQVGERADPTVSMNEIIDGITVGILHRDTTLGTFSDNRFTNIERVAVLVEGEAKPVISGLTVSGAEVGVSYRETTAGELTSSSFSQVGIGVQLEDQAVPLIAENTFDQPAAAAVVARSTGEALVRANTVTEPETLGFGAAGSSDVVFKNNTVIGGETAASVIEQSTAQLVENQFEGQVVSVQVGEEAAPTIADNTIIGASGAAVVYREDAAGTLTGNSVLNPGSVGIQVVDNAHPTVQNNLLVAGLEVDADEVENEGENETGEDAEAEPESEPETDAETDPERTADEAVGTVALLYAGTAFGEASVNELLGFAIGVQIGEEASPQVTKNSIDGGTERGVGFLIRDSASGRIADNTTTLHSIGFQIDGLATSEVENNVVTWASDVAFLIRGEGLALLSGNTCPADIPGIALLDGATPDLGENDCAVVSG